MSYVEWQVEGLPPSINSLSGRHWSVRVQAKKLWIAKMYHALLTAGHLKTLRTWCQLNERLRLDILVLTPQLYDKDNLYSVVKIPIDCLKDDKFGLGCIVNDSEQYLELDVQQEKAAKGSLKFRISRR
jgi:hypothetical protein